MEGWVNNGNGRLPRRVDPGAVRRVPLPDVDGTGVGCSGGAHVARGEVG
ncbi:MAG: hypothetical protein J2P58_14230 [Acidimicrobiaceae bacterium]|nr:hypothetical protein [Acidimicrobiaceae bacterium]